MDIKKKFCIGTALFGFNYGALNNKKIKDTEIKKIFLLCKKKKINFFDTSLNYGVSQKKISNLSHYNKYISKINVKEKIEVRTQVKKIFKELKIKKIYAILIHNSKILLTKNGLQILERNE